jgi:hypothetical protein
MDQAKVTSLSATSAAAHRVANDVYVPVPSRPRRYNRGVLWADRVGLPDPDFSHLSLMRAMERKNKG